MPKLEYVEGDATHPFHPSGSETKVIAHVCNDVGGWGSGFVVALSKRCKEPERQYRLWALDGVKYEDIPFKVGQIQCVPYCSVHSGLWVCNMVAQCGMGNYTFNNGDKQRKLPPIRYGALEECMLRLVCWIKTSGANISIHSPRFGAGLAGGDWNKIEDMIKDIWVDFGDLNVTIYDLKVQ